MKEYYFGMLNALVDVEFMVKEKIELICEYD